MFVCHTLYTKLETSSEQNLYSGRRKQDKKKQVKYVAFQMVINVMEKNKVGKEDVSLGS